MNVKERLKEYIKYKNLTVISFERSINRSNGYVSSISKSIQPETILAISEKYPDLSIEWLLIGKGRMIKTISIANNQEQHFKNIVLLEKEIHGNDPSYYEKRANELKKTLSILNERVSILERTIADKNKIISLLEEMNRKRTNK
ncbi:MAG: hypothetical protein J6V18_01220 [Bacteroidales bacterium]|nr:hypothetical protein [Bacteroidales bacterium]